MKRLFALALCVMGFATSAHADFIPATWTDHANVGGGIYIDSGDSHTYVHDLNDDGFRPNTDLIDSFLLSIDLADESDHWYDSLELAIVDLPGILGDDLIWSWDFDANGDEYGGWSVAGLLQLNELGTLTVTVSSLFGDFNLVGSTLTAHGLSNVDANVPEPGALGLLGIGLVGMALSMRRRKKLLTA